MPQEHRRRGHSTRRSGNRSWWPTASPAEDGRGQRPGGARRWSGVIHPFCLLHLSGPQFSPLGKGMGSLPCRPHGADSGVKVSWRSVQSGSPSLGDKCLADLAQRIPTPREIPPAHPVHTHTCAPVCIRGQGCPLGPHLLPAWRYSLGDMCRAPTHRPPHAHQHVCQIFHFKVHQGEQWWADCKGAPESSEAGLGCRAGGPGNWGARRRCPRNACGARCRSHPVG